MRYLLELTLRDPATGTDTVLRLTERSSYSTRRTDTPSLAWYRPYAKRLVNYEVDLFAGGLSFGGGGGSVGEALINNASRWLDPYQGYAWRHARVLQGPLGRFVRYADFVPILTLTVSGREYIGDEVSVRFGESKADWAKAIPRRAYLGNNSGPTGLEGNGELVGVLAPVVIGMGLGLPVQWVNPSLLIAQWHDGATDGPFTVATGGANVTIAGDVGASITNPGLSVAAGTCVTDNSRGLVRFGSTPPRKVTVDGIVLSAPNVSGCLAQLAALIGTSDPIAVDASFGTGANMGWALSGGETAADIVDVMARSAGAWWRVDGTRTLLGAKVPNIAGASPTWTLQAADIAGLDLVAAADTWGDAPIWRVEVEYSRAWSPLLDAEIDPAITNPTRNTLMKSYRLKAMAENPSTLAAFPDAQVLPIQAAIINTIAAQELADRLLAIHGSVRQRRIASVSSRIAPGQLAPGRVGQIAGAGMPLKFIHTGTSTEDGRTFQLRLFG